MRTSLLTLGFVLCMSACSNAQPPSASAAGGYVITAGAAPSDEPNARSQRPAFKEQTRAPAPAAFSKVKVETVATGLDQPWGVQPLDDGRFVVTEKSGALRVITKDRRVLAPLPGVPKVYDGGQGGLLDVSMKPTAANQWLLCISYAEPREDNKNGTAVACSTASGAENLTLTPFKVVFRQEPAWRSSLHFGSRIVFTGDDMMFVTLGERSSASSRVFAQDINTTLGKVVRIKTGGGIPADNPFVAKGGPAAQVWSYGHRNLQAASLDASGQLWTIEHGPRGGDELNKPEAGKNYGWPVITYGEDYSGLPIGKGITAQSGMEQPVYYWDPVIAPSGMVVYSGNLFADWRGDVLVGGLASQSLTHLKMRNGRVVSEERFQIGARVRDVAQGPDGALYLVTDTNPGDLLRLTPAQ